MRPTSLVVRGLKCWDDLELELSPLMAIQGANGSGKTAIIQAIRLSLLGYDPETGKHLNQTRKLIAPNVAEAEIGLSFDSGFAIRRRFGAKSDTQVLPPRGEKNGGECQERINEETGGLVVSLDLGEFLDLSDEKRRGWLFEHLPRDAAELTWETFAEWTDGEGELGGVVRSLWDTCVQTAPNAVVGLGSAIEMSHRDYLESDRDRLNQEKVVARGDELERTFEKPGVVEPGALKELQDRRGSVDQRIGTARAGAEARETIDARHSNAEDKLAAVMRELDHTEKVRADLVIEIAELPDPEDITELRDDFNASQGPVLDVCRRGAELATATADAARSCLDRLHGRREELTTTAEQGCQFAELGCKTDTSGLVAEKLEHVEREIIEQAAVFHESVEEELAAQKILATAGNARDDVSRRLELARREASRRTDLEHSAEHKLTVMQELRERCGIHRKAMEEAAAELHAVTAPTSGANVLAVLYGDRDTIDEAIAKLQEDLDAGVRYTTTLEGIERERGVLDEKLEKATALKELDGNLRRLRGHVIELMIGPLQEEANEVLHAMDPGKTFRFIFERENKAILDFGFEEDGVLRLFAAASKGERVMLAVSFLGALLSVIAPAMRLLVIDDVEQLDPVRRKRLMLGLARLADRWDMVLIAGACDFETLEGWALHVLGTAEEAAA